MRLMLTLFFSILLLQLCGQNCDSFDRGLFHMLPSEFPDTVNCIDENGHKQGWWLVYKVKYNPIDKPDELAKGDYVERYFYGIYQKNRKIGTWKYVENVHQVYVHRIDSFFYSKDSTIISSEYADGGWNVTKTYFNSDSSIIEYSHLLPREDYALIIKCDQSLPIDKQCKLIYRGEEIKAFPTNRLEIEKTALTINYVRERRLINEKKGSKL